MPVVYSFDIREEDTPVTGAPAPSVEKTSVGIRGRVVVAVLLINLFVGGLAGYSVWLSLRQYQERASVDARNLAQTMAQYVSDAIDRVDYGLTDAVGEVGRQLAGGSIDSASLNRFLVGQQSRQPSAEATRIADARGEILYGSVALVPRATPRSVADRDYFIVQRDHPGSGLVVSEPHVSGITGRWSLFLSRRIDDSQGRFWGICYSVLALDAIADFFARIDVGAKGGISLRDQAMAIILRYPDPGGEFRGNNVVSPELDSFLRRGETSGTYYSGTTWDGTARTVSFQKVGALPLYINVGLASADYLVPWRGEARWTALLVLSFLIVTLAWSVHFCRNLEQRAMAERLNKERLERQLDEKTVSLRHHAEALERSNGDLEQFASIASHDLREPLRMISLYLSLLERRFGPALVGEGMEFLGFARDAALRMDRLVLDLLEFSRIDRRGTVMERVEILPPINNAVANLALSIRESGAQVRLAETLDGAVVMGDGGQLSRLFQNLIANAIKYRAADRPPEIDIGCRREGGEWEFLVADNGIGIEAQYFERIFGIFQRLHTNSAIEGTGIGLAVCKKVVDRHRGRIWLDSIPGRGTTFHVTLPAA